jgi:hypothetical protein
MYIARLTKRARMDHKMICVYTESVKDFKKALYQYASQMESAYTKTFIDAYLNKSVRPVKILEITLRKNEPILLCAVKDDLEKIKLQVDYHRKIGVKHFVYIDNISIDGTFEWLKEQPDVSLFTVNERFSSTVKNAWRRQVTDILGYDRWYLVLDSDELFMYPGVETKNINRYIDFLESSKIKSTLSPMIDMYSKGKIFEENIDMNKILDTYCYFDTDTYKKVNTFSTCNVIGGPRVRVFSKKENISSWLLSKYALTKLSRKVLIGTHQNYPYKYNIETKGAIAFLLHYKFLPGDNEKYKEIVASEVYSNKSEEYKQYMEILEKKPNSSFYYGMSQKLNNSMDLMKINIIDKDFFNKFLANE